mmetsp:Transcript_38344/g.90467  ORF Transcript_38344/g.90467 Transcript_38344/m.90467 type:complete len:214 (-) Transcript_38344:106-747(-)
MMWMVMTSSSWIPYPLVPPSPKYDSSPLITSVMNPASIESVSNTEAAVRSRFELAMSLKMRRRESSAVLAAVPKIRSAFTTSWRSVLATISSQKMFTPPRTTGIEAESVVFICCGSWPPLGEVGRPIASWSLALTTRCTKTLLLSVSMPSAATVGSQSMPSGMLKDTKWSGTDAGLTHIWALGAHIWLAVVESGKRSSKVVFSGNAAYPSSSA